MAPSMTTTACLISASVLWPSAESVLRQELLAQRLWWQQEEHMLGAAGSPGNVYPEHFYDDQLLDHFNKSDDRRYAQRYFVNWDHFKPGGPILLNIGGEGPLNEKQVSGYLSNVLFAEKLGGAAVAVEHRFYGKSQPFNSLATEHLSFLTSQQALADLARFQDWFVANRSLGKSQWFCMGGSYPGNLAAWYRLKYADKTSGCWSSSGPVQAQEVWPGFGEKVWEAVSTDVDGSRDDSVATKLYAGYEQFAGLVQDPTPEAFESLTSVFNLCPGTLVSQQDKDYFENAITSYVGLVMQYNNTRTPRLTDIRRIVKEADTPFEAVLDVSKFLNLTVGDGPGKCVDNSIGSFYKQLLNSTLPTGGSGNAGRTWTWQTCNEFGYFQTATAVFGKPTLYTRGASSPSQWQGVCENVFGLSATSVSAKIAATNAYYGAKDPEGISRVFYTHGGLDAWSLLGVTSYPPNTREVYAEVAPLGSHCVGLYPPMEGEVPGATSVRNRALSLFKQWLKPQQWPDLVV
eukprot:TRINITY_DN48775_c0_g1_i1.p1 TRINITY_DN48775_c0_g1~~TRINITY_DN48775_c0_g1_i1.p1  ORF type:complete len:516 (+),score=56.72 TRINITY_DN48775_c0_g1_i1:113-1660(+)